jgi:hypothetical protein
VLWAFAGAQVTVYRIAHGRGSTDAAAVLGEGDAGVLERDGWAPYRRLVHATHQSCLAHLLRRCRELLADADRGQATTRTWCAASWSTRWRCGRPATPAPWTRPRWPPRPGAWGQGRQAGGRGDPLSAQPPAAEPPGPGTRSPVHLPARQWRAGHQLACRARHPSRGGDPQDLGRQPHLDRAVTWQTLTSVVRTASQQGHDPVELLARLLRAPDPIVANLAIPGR